MNTGPSSPDTRQKRSRRLKIFGCVMAILILAVITAPWILAQTRMRDRLINKIMGTPNLTASTERAHFGWFSPLAVEDVSIAGKQHRFNLDVKRIASERSWPSLLASSPHLGAISIDQPHVTLHLPLGKAGTPAAMLSPTFTAVVSDASLTVHCEGLDNSVIDLHGLNLTAHVLDTDDGRVLTLDPFDMLTREDLTPQLCSQLVQLINPTLRDAAHVEGQISLSVDELRIPIGLSREQLIQRAKVEGQLELYSVLIETESALPRALGKVLSDVYGISSPDRLRVVKDAKVRFQAHHGRLRHEGLRLGFPDIDPALQITSSGSVGLDESLDLHLEVPRLDSAKRKQQGPVHCHITGTISHPRMSAKNASLVIRVPGAPKALVDVDGIDLIARVADSAAGRVLIVDPVQVFERAQLSERQADFLVHLIKPEIRYSPNITGEISLSLDAVRIPLTLSSEHWIEDMEMRGQLAIHQVTTLANDPIRQTLIKLLADLYEKKVTDVVRIAHDTDVAFHLRDGRLHYEGLRLGFPDVSPTLQVTSQGSVGLDETLDMQLEVPRLDTAKLKEAGPVQCRLTGTIDEPRLFARNASLVVRLPDLDDPLVDVDQIDLSLRIEDSLAGRVLVVDPVNVFQKEEIGRQQLSGLIHLIAPEINDTPQLAGEISLSLDKVRIPFRASKDELLAGSELKGRLTLHEVTTAVVKPVRLALAKLLADLYGKDATEIVRIAHDAEIQFHVRGGRLHYEGLQLGFPDIDPALIVKSSGSVGIDETLDLHFELPRLDKAKREELGALECHVTGTLSQPVLSAKNASLVLRLSGHAETLLDVDDIDLVVRVEQTPVGKVLSIDSFKVLERQKFTSGLSDELLRLVAPTLSDVADVEGEVSLTLDKFRVPLGRSPEALAQDLELTGQLQLHEIATTVETPLLRAVVKVLADLYGKQPSEVVRIVKNAEVQFKVCDGRLYHEGLTLGFPDISPQLVGSSSGSVGLDKSLDLILEVPSVLAEAGSASKNVTRDIIRFSIKGTLDDPVVLEIEQ